MAKLKITPKQMYQFMENFGRNQYAHQRLGQAFVNEFFTDQQDPDLFYEQDRNRAEKKIADRYVDWEA